MPSGDAIRSNYLRRLRATFEFWVERRPHLHRSSDHPAQLSHLFGLGGKPEGGLRVIPRLETQGVFFGPEKCQHRLLDDAVKGWIEMQNLRLSQTY